MRASSRARASTIAVVTAPMPSAFSMIMPLFSGFFPIVNRSSFVFALRGAASIPVSFVASVAQRFIDLIVIKLHVSFGSLRTGRRQRLGTLSDNLRGSLHRCLPSPEQIDLCQIDDFVATPAQNCFEGEQSESLHLRETYRRRHGEFLPVDKDFDQGRAVMFQSLSEHRPNIF